MEIQAIHFEIQEGFYPDNKYVDDQECRRKVGKHRIIWHKKGTVPGYIPSRNDDHGFDDDHDTRGEYREIDKNRKKTWHSKGAVPGYRSKVETYWKKSQRKKQRHNIRSNLIMDLK